MNRIRMAAICPIPNDPTSWYRGVGPLSELQRTMPELELLFPSTFDWCVPKLTDIVFLQRPCTPDHFQCLAIAKEAGRPVWIDMDDDNTAVPESSPMFDQYSLPDVKKAIVDLARHADVITVSTQFLKNKYSMYNSNVILLPNALDDGLLHLHDQVKDRVMDPNQRMILWRGTPTHFDNLETIEAEIIEVANKYPEWKFGFYGFKPLRIKRKIKNFVHFPTSPRIFDYLKNIVGIQAYALYYPLAANDHSQSRSHVSWLEGTLGAKAFIGPDNEEFTRPGILNFDTPQQFKDHVDNVITGAVDVKKCVADSWEHLLANYRLSLTNQIRKELILKLKG